jgi:pimeloyl-ACP methyl ester carboxylesterase
VSGSGEDRRERGGAGDAGRAGGGGPAPVERRRLRVGPVDGRVLLAGPEEAREAAVFVHGNPGSADDWERLAAAIGGVGRAVALDLPDFGETEAPAGFDHSAAGYAGYLDKALEALGVERAHVVLHDFGGPIGLTWAASAPERLGSVTLIDTGVLPGYRWHRLARVWRTPVLGELFMASTTRFGFRTVIARGEPMGLPREFVDRMYDHYDRRARRAVLRLYRATDEPGSAPPELVERLSQRDLPALVIWGEHDRYVPASYAVRQRELFPSADVHVLASSGHWPFVDAAETVERLLLGFLGPLLRPTEVRA